MVKGSFCWALCHVYWNNWLCLFTCFKKSICFGLDFCLSLCDGTFLLLWLLTTLWDAWLLLLKPYCPATSWVTYYSFGYLATLSAYYPVCFLLGHSWCVVSYSGSPLARVGCPAVYWWSRIVGRVECTTCLKGAKPAISKEEHGAPWWWSSTHRFCPLSCLSGLVPAVSILRAFSAYFSLSSPWPFVAFTFYLNR